jgi:hypothetical protein
MHQLANEKIATANSSAQKENSQNLADRSTKGILEMPKLSIAVVESKQFVSTTLSDIFGEEIEIIPCPSIKDTINHILNGLFPYKLMLVDADIIFSDSRQKFFRALKQNSNIEVVILSTEIPPKFKRNQLFTTLGRFPLCFFNMAENGSYFNLLLKLISHKLRNKAY